MKIAIVKSSDIAKHRTNRLDAEYYISKKVKFKEWNCIVEKNKYKNGRTLLELIQEETGEPIAVATVNVPEYNVPEGHVLIKGCIEEALVNAGIIKPTNESVEMTFVTIKMYKLLI